MKVTGVSIELMVRDVAATVGFWRDQLGFEVVAVEPEGAPTWGAVTLEGVTISFKQDARLRGEFDWFDGMSQGGTTMVCIDVDDLEAWHVEIARRFELIDHPHLTPCGATQFAIRDLDGYVVIFQRFG